jgi:acetyltransferase-like isoleucine patch superfamily enzyme
MSKVGKLLGIYLRSKTGSTWHYACGETLQALLGWIPSLVGIGIRGVAYKLFLSAESIPAIEDHVRLSRAEDIAFGRSVFIDYGCYLHGGPGGLRIGSYSWIMSGCRLQVFNNRNIPHAGISIGERTFIGEESLMRGQGGIRIGNDVLLAPRVQVLAVDHVFTDATRPIMKQGITAQGITIEDGCWIGAGAIILDGVTIGQGSCTGARAVVTASVPAHSLAVGVPARVVRNLLTDPLPSPTSQIYYGGIEDVGA